MVGDPRAIIIKPRAAIIANCSLWVIHFISQQLSEVELFYHIRFQKEHLGRTDLEGEVTCLSLSAYSGSTTQAGRPGSAPAWQVRSPRLAPAGAGSCRQCVGLATPGGTYFGTLILM